MHTTCGTDRGAVVKRSADLASFTPGLAPHLAQRLLRVVDRRLSFRSSPPRDMAKIVYVGREKIFVPRHEAKKKHAL